MTERKINFNEPICLMKGINYIYDSIVKNKQLSGDGMFTKRSSIWMEHNFHIRKVLLTTSCSHALEMAALLLDLEKGDEIIMPSFTFVSTANAFVLRGAKINFVDVREDTMNINETLIEKALTTKTKAIVPVHYAGVSCEMDTILEIASQNNIAVIEDAAQGIFSKYKGRYLGTMGDLGTYSFHETKNFTMGEGGALLVNNLIYEDKAQIIREKGTNRTRFLRGEVDKYSWVDKGSSYLPSDMNAAYLLAQFEMAEEMNHHRISLWNEYYSGLSILQEQGKIILPFIPNDCESNAHIFYIKAKDLNERTELLQFLKSKGITAAFHYVPLHSSAAGKQYGEMIGEDIYTTRESERLLRLPLFFGLQKEEIHYIVEQIKEFYC